MSRSWVSPLSRLAQRACVVTIGSLLLPLYAAAQVTVTFSPSGGTFSSANLSVTMDLCSTDTPILTFQLYFNGGDASGSFTYQGGVPGCTYGKRYTGTVTLEPGSNSLIGDAWDESDNWGHGEASYTYSGGGGGDPSNFKVAYADKFRDVSRCVADCFAATAVYSTPAYVSVDIPRGVTLVYRSDRAKPIGLVEIDATDASPGNVQKYELKLRRPDMSFVTFAGGLQEVFFAAGPSWTRLAAQFDASSLPTEAYDYTAVITTHYYSGGPVQTTIPARVMIVNGSASFLGAGWEIAGYERATVQSDGIMIASGGGSVSFFEGCSGTCQLTSPPGDFSTLNRESDGTYTRRYPDGTQMYFSSAGLLMSVADRFGNGPTFGTDGSGRVFSISDGTGNLIGFTYDGSGRLASIYSPGSPVRTSTFTVDGNGDLTLARDPDNVVNFTASYTAHRISTLVDRRGGSWGHTYAADGGLATLVAPQITANGQPTTPTTQFAGPSRAILTHSAQQTQGQSVPYGLDLRTSVSNPRSYTTYFTTNRWGSPTQIDFPMGPSSTAQYNSTTGQVTQTVSPSGHTINYGWNGVQLTLVQDVTTGLTINATYESAYNRPLTITGNAVAQTFTYPDLKTITVQTGSHPATVIRLDTYGRDSIVTDPAGHVTRFYYTNAGLKNTDSVKAVGRTWYRYDVYGRVRAVVGPDNACDSASYDVLNRVVTATNGTNATTSNAFADNVFLTGVTDANGQITSFTRNALGWITAENRAGSANPLQTAYDVNGNVVSSTNRRGQTVSFVYDALDRITSRSGPDIPTTMFAYARATPSSDGYVAATNSESSDTAVYNAADRLVRAATSRNGPWYRLVYGYNSFGQLSSITATSSQWGGSNVQNFGYSATGALQSLTAWGVSTGLNPGSGNEDLATTITYPNGLVLSRTFGAFHESFVAGYGVPSVQSSLGYQTGLDPSGRVASLTAADNKGRVFVYDNAQRVQRFEKWTMGGQSCPTNEETGCTWSNPTFVSATDFTYDAAGNLTTGVTQLDVPGNRVRAAKGFTFNYDADGNLTSKSGPAFTQMLSWNSLGQLTSVTTNGYTTEFGYDGFGRRVRKSHNGTTTRYLHDRDNVFMELDASGNAIIEYAHRGLDQPHAMRKNELTYYFSRDPMGGSIQALIRASDNAVVSLFRYTPFGELELDDDGVGMPYRFGGRDYDAETNLYYNRSRYYDPLIGRFISEDPIGVDGGVNLYSYANNDPINNSDPFGLECRPNEVESIKYTRNSDGDWMEERLCWSSQGSDGEWRARTDYFGVYGDGHPLGAFLAIQGILNGVGEVSGLNSLGRAGIGFSQGDALRGTIQLAMGLPVGPGGAARVLPAVARTTRSSAYLFNRLARYNGISKELATARLHALKYRLGIGGQDVLFDMSGGVWDPRTREWLGSLTQGGARWP